MELPLGTEAGRKATHDFLSLYSSPNANSQQDPTPQGSYPKTHDFLQPLDRVGKNVMTMKEDVKGGTSAVARPPVEHLLPGGIGTYSISYFNQRVSKPEGSLFNAQTSSIIKNDENSSCSSYGGNGFTLWDESAVKKGKTGKENIAAERHILRGVNVVGGQWTSLQEKPSQSSSSHKHNATNFTSLSSSRPSSSQKNQSFMDMISSARNDQEEDEEEEEDEFIIKKEPSSNSKGSLSVKVEAKTVDQKPNTPRSKHSATEQRRRSKINDRFQKLREIIPNSEQKRDKASFLLEVIDYIQFLQEKVNRYENSPSIWNHESKIMHWRNNRIADGFLDHTRGANTEPAPPSVFATKFDENKASVSRSLPFSGQNLVDSDLSNATTLKERVQQSEFTSKVKIFPPCRTHIAASPVSPKQASGVDKYMSWPPSQFLRSCTTECTSAAGNKMKDQELTIESGTINISSVYSQGLLNTLTQALQSTGVDLSQASVSVQIDIGKRANGTPHSSTSVPKGDNVEGGLPHSMAPSGGEEVEHALKKLRTS